MRNFYPIIGCLFVSIAIAEDKPASIAVVKTYDDLKAVKPIDRGDGVKFRLGLEANTISQWSGAYLYGLVEGFTPPTQGSDNSGGGTFGPVRVKFEPDGDLTSKELDQKKWGGKDELIKGTYLFVRALRMNQNAKYRVTVTDGQKKVLAEVIVGTSKEKFHPWTPWFQHSEKSKDLYGGIALPGDDSIGPYETVDLMKAKGDLPKFLPSDDKPALTIERKGDEIIVTSITNFTTSVPRHHFLARWWVNGKPFNPAEDGILWKFDGYGRVYEDKELRLKLELQPSNLGAKPGDKIGLQLLHSEHGWVWCSDSETTHSASSGKSLNAIKVSNRIDFELK